jgi:hypothetical protein
MTAAEGASARVTGVAVALGTSAMFGAAVGGGSGAPAQLHISAADKHAVRETSIIALISHEVARLPNSPRWACEAPSPRARSRLRLVPSMQLFVRCASVLGTVRRRGSNSPTGLARTLLGPSNAPTPPLPGRS